MYLLVGLGNPEPRYANNRHNIGFMTVDEIVHRHSFSPWRSRFQGIAADGLIGGEKVLALKPTTYMNESGRSVGEALRYFKIPVENVTVFYDELDLAPGKIRVKVGGGLAGHNGLKSIQAHIGDGYRKIRMGIGHPGDRDRVSHHVLGDFSKADAQWRDPLIEAVADAVDLLIAGDDSGFASKVALATKPQRPKPPRKDGADSPSGDRNGI